MTALPVLHRLLRRRPAGRTPRSRFAGRALAWAVALPVAAWLSACSSLPPAGSGAPSTFMTDTAQTRLGRAVAAADPRDGRSGLATLDVPLDAFAARLALVRAAERSLDLQYYIWRPDVTGLVLLEELRRAAERGVRVRLLLDDNGIGGLDADLAFLESLPGIEVRLFNPYPHRAFKVLGYLTEFTRLNHRMHNKALIADAQAAIVGGRNIGDAYFGADPGLDFADLDVLAAGPVAQDASRSFDDYWNSAQVWPVAALAGAPPAEAAARWRERTEALAQDERARAYFQALKASVVADGLARDALALDWVRMRLAVDPPAKAAGGLPAAELLAAHLAEALGGPREQVDLVSPYFVPGAEGTASLARLAGQGLKVRVLTNSLAATDVAAVHAGYARRREALLAAGVRLHELKPDPATRAGARRKGEGSGWRPGLSAASLHGKTFSVDRDRAFVGSFNVDPRSYRLNTEMGLVIHSPKLAAAISDSLDRELAGYAYELRLDADGRLQWIDHTPAGPVVHTRDPEAGLWRRTLVRVLSWLPIEGLL